MRRLASRATIAIALAACRHPRPAPSPVANQATTTARPPWPLLPGSVGLAIEDIQVGGACIDHRIRVRRIARGDDPAFAAAVSFEPPHLASGIDGAPVNHRQLEVWVREWTHYIRDAQDHLSRTALDDRAPARDRIEAIARLVQLYDLAGANILAIGAPPRIADDPDLLRSYCDALAAQADTIRAKADDTRARCRDFTARLVVGAGWWTAVCAGPATDAHPP